MYRLSLILQLENLYLELTTKINWLTGKQGNWTTKYLEEKCLDQTIENIMNGDEAD